MIRSFVAITALLLAPTIGAAASLPTANLHWRETGPAIAGGRVTSVAGSSQNPHLYYLGAAGGGVWKSNDGGASWKPVFDHESVGSIGAVAIDPSNENTVWVGTGESNPRNDVSYGDGLYKSTDGGKTWKNVGLRKTQYISRILIDPSDPQHVIVGALGDVFANSTARGAYVTFNGGKTWSKTLDVGPSSGVSDLAMNPHTPNVIFAGVWEFQRRPWTFRSGGKRDGIYRSTDGGRTWHRLSGGGLPTGITGRIGLAVAPSDPNRVYALIEAKHGILWRSDDDGNTWKLVSSNTLVDQRPFYFSHIEVDPSNPNTVYTASTSLAESTDGGLHFKAIAQNVHGDFHAIWIAPNDPRRMIVGEDGGYALTVNGGQTWAFWANLPIGQFYRVGLGNDNPYTICGGLQDNNSYCGPSNSLDMAGNTNASWYAVVYDDDGQWAIPDPHDSKIIWSDGQDGALFRFDRTSREYTFAEPYFTSVQQDYDIASSPYRFNWESPIGFAPWNPHIVWFGGNVVFQTTDRGLTWKPISPDLTRNDKAHQGPSGGPITHDVTGAEYTDTILDIEGSQLSRGEIWVGTDDGIVQMTRDDGAHWKNVTPPGANPNGRFETVAPSPLQRGTAYAVEDSHLMGDNAPEVWVTDDYGAHWRSITNGLPHDLWTRSIRPDIHNPNLVYLGTEEGVWVSYDRGTHWQSLRNNMPPVSVRDIRIQPQFDDLVIATHGRSIWVMDDLRPLQQLPNAVKAGAMLFAPRTSYEYNLTNNTEGTYTNFAAKNPPYGVPITYYQAKPQAHVPLLAILDSSGRVVRTLKGTNLAGLNRIVWNFTTAPPVRWTGAANPAFAGPSDGATVVPGTYSVRIALNGRTFVQRFAVKPDPQATVTLAQMRESYDAFARLNNLYSSVDTMLNHLDSIAKAIAAEPALSGPAAAALARARSGRTAVMAQLTANYSNGEDSVSRPGALRENLDGALSSLQSFPVQGIITQAAAQFYARIDAEYRAARNAYNAYVRSLSALNVRLRAAGARTLPVIPMEP
ncbi:MAG: hypothetical protein HKL91_09165 [Candidatus Eremiobacteraeota bacterium]|uniref:Sortilin N-terminal domain-containing protein n=1 Tax=mine drainage metagenome TaxID=410659 RepID=E6PIW5_9ZZZZ|nr:hypothetical protein [Candidatus Eremiobacteraeota bacterium]